MMDYALLSPFSIPIPATGSAFGQMGETGHLRVLKAIRESGNVLHVRRALCMYVGM